MFFSGYLHVVLFTVGESEFCSDICRKKKHTCSTRANAMPEGYRQSGGGSQKSNVKDKQFKNNSLK